MTPWTLSPQESSRAWELFHKLSFRWTPASRLARSACVDAPLAPWASLGAVPRTAPPIARFDLSLRSPGYGVARAALSEALRACAAPTERVWLLNWQHPCSSCVPRGASGAHEGPFAHAHGDGDDHLALATNLRFGYFAHHDDRASYAWGSSLLSALERALPRGLGHLESVSPGLDLDALAALSPAEARRDYELALAPEALSLRAHALRALARSRHRWASELALELLRACHGEAPEAVLFDLAVAALERGAREGAEALEELLARGAFSLSKPLLPAPSGEVKHEPELGGLSWESLLAELARLPPDATRAARRLADRYYAPRVGARPTTLPPESERDAEWHEAPRDLEPYEPLLESHSALARRRDLAACAHALAGVALPREEVLGFLFEHWDWRAERFDRCESLCSACAREWPRGEALAARLLPEELLASPRRFLGARPRYELPAGAAHPPRLPERDLDLLLFASDPAGVARAEALLGETLARLRGWGYPSRPEPLWSFSPCEEFLPQLDRFGEHLGDALSCCALLLDSSERWLDAPEALRRVVRWDLAWREHRWARLCDASGLELDAPFAPLLELYALGYQLHQRGDAFLLYCPPAS